MTRRIRGPVAWLVVLVPLLPAFAADPPVAAAPRETVDRPAAAADPRAAPVDISDRVIRKAIVDSKDPMDDIVPVGHVAFGSGASMTRQRIDRRFKEAEIPTCLTPDAFRFAPAVIGFVGFSGVLALPFWLDAIASGKCRH